MPYHLDTFYRQDGFMISLSPYHTFGLSAQCHSLFLLEREDQIAECLAVGQPNYILGEGSNTVFVDDFDGTVIINRLKGMAHTETDNYHQIAVMAGENWHKFVTICMNNGWYGLENLALIPGSVGAAPIQNIGAYGVEVNQFIHCVKAVDVETGKWHTFAREECEFSYRDSVFKRLPRWLVTEVVFRLPKPASMILSYKGIAEKGPETPEDLFNAVVDIRQSKLPDPKVVGNAGSFFKNPTISSAHWNALKATFPEVVGFPVEGNRVKVAAAWLIDSLGFKQKRVGGIGCHHNQPLVLINACNGKGHELVSLAQSIMAEVNNIYKIQLEPEARLIGKQGLICL